MGVLGDTLDEFKKAKTPEKVFIVGGALAVLAIALYLHKQSTSNTPAQSATGASTGGSSTGGGIQTVPTNNGGSVPILPPGLTPIFDSMGNLIGYQPTPTTPTGSTTPPPIEKNVNPGNQGQGLPFNPWAPQLPMGTSVPSKAGSFFTYGGKTYTVLPGSNGVTWGVLGKMSVAQAENTPIGSQKFVLTGPTHVYSQYGLPTNVKQGGGPYGTRVLGVHRSRLAPTKEGRPQYTHATKIYSMRVR